MGIPPMEVSYLRHAHAMGVGTADLSAITIVGDPISGKPRRIRRHSSDPLLRLAGSLPAPAASLPRPHFGMSTSRQSDRTNV
jgi:hypothetical protein